MDAPCLCTQNRNSEFVNNKDLTSFRSPDVISVPSPTNDAFDDAAEAVLGEGFNGTDLVEELDAETLSNILLYHVVPGNRYSNSILSAKRIRTMNGEFLKVDGTTLVGNATSADLVVDLVDIPARNGVIHVIDFVLLP